MGMSTHVVGIIPKDDEEFKRMKSIYENCVYEGIIPPKEVHKYFNLEEREDAAYYDLEGIADEKGVVVESNVMKQATEEYRDEMSEGYDIDIRKLPDNVKIIRFYNSW